MQMDVQNQSQPSVPGPEIDPKKSKKLVVILIGLAVIVGLAVLALVFFPDGSAPDVQADAKLTVDAPTESVSGSETSYEVVVENVSNVRLSEVTLEVFYPQGFDFIDSTVPDSADSQMDLDDSDEPPRLFELADLEPGEESRIFIVGILSGNIQEIKTFTARLRYVPVNFRSPFEISTTAHTEVLPPALSLRLDGPAQIFAGQRAEYDVVVRNEAEQDFGGIGLLAVLPNDFQVDSSIETEESGEIRWDIGRLAPREEARHEFAGSFRQDSFGEVVIQVEQFVSDGTERLSAGRSFVFTEVLQVPLVVEHTASQPQSFVQGRSKEGLLAGDDLTYEVNWRSRGQSSLENVAITLSFSENVFDFTRLSNQEGVGQRVGSRIRWTPAANPELRLINPGQSGSFRFSLPISSNLRIENPVASSEASFVSSEFPDAIKGNRIEQKISTTLQLTAGVQSLGESRYRISFTASNTVNAVDQVSLSARVPSLDTQIETVPGINFNQSAGILTWGIGRLGAFENRTVSFEMIASSGVLLEELVLSGRDGFVKEEVRDEADRLRASGF